MEREGSLPHSQVPSTYPYPEPAQYSPYPPHPTYWRSTLILSSHLLLGLPSGLFPRVFSPKSCTRISSPPYALILSTFEYLDARMLRSQSQVWKTLLWNSLFLSVRQDVIWIFTVTPCINDTNCLIVQLKGKAIPLQAWRGPEVSRRLRLPDFKTIGTWRW